MWEATHDALWEFRAGNVLSILLHIQQPDGGFDIGYDFNFGRLHRKGQSTSPELVGLVALCEYARLFGEEQVRPAAVKAVEWIRKHALDMGERKFAIPYSPITINEVMVYNGTSFACGALGCYLGQFGGDEELHDIYNGMVQYMEFVLSKNENLPGCFWYYCDQLRDDLDEMQKSKIDYYHQMQQVEMHALAHQVSPLNIQLRIIGEAADHIVALHERHPIIPYTNNPKLFKNQIHLWGLSSVVSGLLEAAVMMPDRSELYRKVASDILDWVVSYAWNGYHFEAILTNDGSHVDTRLYMVRSDAWVFNALAAAAKHLGSDQWRDITEKCYQKMESVDYSGPESHASSLRSQIAITIWSFFKRMVGK
jgi:hypothetical protein